MEHEFWELSDMWKERIKLCVNSENFRLIAFFNHKIEGLNPHVRKFSELMFQPNNKVDNGEKTLGKEKHVNIFDSYEIKLDWIVVRKGKNLTAFKRNTNTIIEETKIYHAITLLSAQEKEKNT